VVYQSFKDNERKFTTDAETIRKLLSDILQVRPVYLVVDGIDEEQEIRRGYLIKDLLWLLDTCPSTRLFISSRDEHDLGRLLGKKVIRLRIGRQNSKDIEKYVEIESSKLGEKLVSCGAAPGSKIQIQESAKIVAEKSEGVYRFTSLAGPLVVFINVESNKTRDDPLCGVGLSNGSTSWHCCKDPSRVPKCPERLERSASTPPPCQIEMMILTLVYVVATAES
jgi:hypothetical protein